MAAWLKLWSLNQTNVGTPCNDCAYVPVHFLDPSFVFVPTEPVTLHIWHANHSQCTVSSYQFWHMSGLLVTLYMQGKMKFKLNTMYLCNAWDVEIASGGKSCNLENCLFTRCSKWSSTTKKKIKGTQVFHSSASLLQMSLSPKSSSSSRLYGVQNIYVTHKH